MIFESTKSIYKKNYLYKIKKILLKATIVININYLTIF